MQASNGFAFPALMASYELGWTPKVVCATGPTEATELDKLETVTTALPPHKLGWTPNVVCVTGPTEAMELEKVKTALQPPLPPSHTEMEVAKVLTKRMWTRMRKSIFASKDVNAIAAPLPVAMKQKTRTTMTTRNSLSEWEEPLRAANTLCSISAQACQMHKNARIERWTTCGQEMPLIRQFANLQHTGDMAEAAI